MKELVFNTFLQDDELKCLNLASRKKIVIIDFLSFLLYITSKACSKSYIHHRFIQVRIMQKSCYSFPYLITFLLHTAEILCRKNTYSNIRVSISTKKILDTEGEKHGERVISNVYSKVEPSCIYCLSQVHHDSRPRWPQSFEY